MKRITVGGGGSRLLHDLVVLGNKKQQNQYQNHRYFRQVSFLFSSVQQQQQLQYYYSSQSFPHVEASHCSASTTTTANQNRFFSSSSSSGNNSNNNNNNNNRGGGGGRGGGVSHGGGRGNDNNKKMDDKNGWTTTRPADRFRLQRPTASSSNSSSSSSGNNSSESGTVLSRYRIANDMAAAAAAGGNYRVGTTINQGSQPKNYFPPSNPYFDGSYKEPDEAERITPNPEFRMRPNVPIVYSGAPLFPGDFSDYDDTANEIFTFDDDGDLYTKNLLQATLKTREEKMDKYDHAIYPGKEKHDAKLASVLANYDDDDDDYDSDDDDSDDDDDEYTKEEMEDIRTTDAMMKRLKLKNDMMQAQREKWIVNSLTPVRTSQIDERGRAYGHGGRKTSTARVWIQSGFGEIVVNKKPFDEYFERQTHRGHAIEPLIATETLGLFDVQCTVSGGGKTGQAGAIRHGLARALNAYDPNLYRPVLKYFKLLTRDSRQVERKKIGHLKARKSPQWVRR